MKYGWPVHLQPWHYEDPTADHRRRCLCCCIGHVEAFFGSMKNRFEDWHCASTNIEDIKHFEPCDIHNRT